ncbi:H-NS histone family protein [Paraburkholderia sp. MMS20-SJTR3]|uniref:H-NS histone family protein n=1 Tax=Paraburkholderia sejongensis TaxID=2886946 RepID=A0ABS8K4Y9_9BURK|nr:H-NS family nucleoid-associated regulatory protein [Paraburkholderia sp. MMS20-SJTR3]MCC8397206.1 H-NS histone family protein [Paraburkholderia sp. MMS20-SJTR3]
MDERKRDSMIAYLRHRMEEFGIKPDDLAAALASESMAKKAERYRSATGDSWDGNGEMPQWLKQAISAGQSIEHFELVVDKPAPAVPQPKKQVDWSNDPFAGTRLARPGNR